MAGRLVLSLRCPICGRVGPIASITRRMEEAGTDGNYTVALLQTAHGQGRMSKARRLQLDELARLPDPRVHRALIALERALAQNWLAPALRTLLRHITPRDLAAAAYYQPAAPPMVGAVAPQTNGGLRDPTAFSMSAEHPVVGAIAQQINGGIRRG